MDDKKTHSVPKICEFCGLEFGSNRELSGHRIGKHIRGIGLKNATIKIDHLSEAQKGYLRAFLDGEGGIQITRTYRKKREYKLALHPTVYFCNTNREVIETIRDWLGGGCLVTRNGDNGHKDTYVLHITGTRKIHALLKCLRPYLIVKLRQADVMIGYCESRLAHYRGIDRRFNELELKLYTALFDLNKKGGRIQRQPMVV